MITIKEAEEILKKEYHSDNFIYLIKDILFKDFKFDTHQVLFSSNLFKSVKIIGYSDNCFITIFEVLLNDGCQNKRVAITQEMFKILRGLKIDNAVVSFVNQEKSNYRISLLTSKYEFEGDKIIKTLSNPRRYSYYLGFGAKTKTAYKYLIEKGSVSDLDDLISRFSVEVVNKQFYSEIATSFTELVGGERNGRNYSPLLVIPGEKRQNKFSEFAVRLIGRIVFCRFLCEKHSENGVPLLPLEVLSINRINSSENYYHQVLEPLFFELLNTNQSRRKEAFNAEKYQLIPYLNGGLFNPHIDDHYSYDSRYKCGKFSNVIIPNEWFLKLFKVLNEYNFTVDENTAYDIELSIDPEMLGRIFENLLAEINPETGENAKKSTGSFYTPRDIVDFMVDASIKEYLFSKTRIDKRRLEALISYSKESDDSNDFSNIEKKQIIDSLYKITILDPACGSGAFPIGMLQKIVYLLQELDPGAVLWLEKTTENIDPLFRKEIKNKFDIGSLNYIRKLSVIKNSIFGIDLQPIAVEISRLRCFLSLIIEEKVNDYETNRGINPLPNLDFKFISANSLIHLDAGQQLSLFDNDDHIKALKSVRDEYFNSDSERRSELKLHFLNIQQEMLLQNINSSNIVSKRYYQLSAWKPFQNETTNWFDQDWMFGIKNGFDIVIGNPPYVQLQDNKGHLAKQLTNEGYETFDNNGDLYCIFYEMAYNSTKNGGLVCFITSNKWMMANYGKRLRNFLSSKTNPLLLMDFGGYKVFESATVDTNILLFEKRNNMKETFACRYDGSPCFAIKPFMKANSGILSYDSGEATWTIMSEVEAKIKKKIDSLGTPLKKWDIKINKGIMTGFNDAFYINNATYESFISINPELKRFIKPLFRGRNIEKYYTPQSFENYVIVIDDSFPIKRFPSVLKHLEKYASELKNRAQYKRGDHDWYAIDNCPSTSLVQSFDNEKIIYSNMTQSPSFCVDLTGSVSNDKTFILTGESKTIYYLCGVLNSKLYDFELRKICSGLGQKGLELRKIFMNELPVIPENSFNRDAFNSVVETTKHIIQLKKNGLDTSRDEMFIDSIVYQMFGLDGAEIEYLNGTK